MNEWKIPLIKGFTCHWLYEYQIAFAALVRFLDLKNNWFDFSSRVLVVASGPHYSLARTMNGEANVLDYLGHYWLVLHQKLGFIKNTNATQMETFHFVFIYDEIILNSDSWGQW